MKSALQKDKDYFIYVTYMPTGQRLEFDGYINSFSDTVSPSAVSEDMYGRMDPLQKYKNTTRKVSIEFDLVSECDEDGLANALKVKALQSFLYPVYDGTSKSTINNNTISSIYSPPLIRLDWNVHLQECYGYLEPISVTWSKEDPIFFYSGDDRALIFGIYRLKLSMTVLHDYKLGWSKQAGLAPGTSEFNATKGPDSLAFPGAIGSRGWYEGNKNNSKDLTNKSKINKSISKKALGTK